MSANIERSYSLVHGRRITVNHNKMTSLKKKKRSPYLPYQHNIQKTNFLQRGPQNPERTEPSLSVVLSGWTEAALSQRSACCCSFCQRPLPSWRCLYFLTLWRFDKFVRKTVYHSDTRLASDVPSGDGWLSGQFENNFLLCWAHQTSYSLRQFNIMLWKPWRNKNKYKIKY